jgi:hypothetical protein
MAGGSYPVEENLMVLARANMQVNLAVNQRDADASSHNEIPAALA